MVYYPEWFKLDYDKELFAVLWHYPKDIREHSSDPRDHSVINNAAIVHSPRLSRAPEWKDRAFQNRWKRQTTVLNVHGLEIPIVFRCNLNCNYCAHLSQYMQDVPLVSLEMIEKQLKDWTPRIASEQLRIIGGEPLLHPQIEDVLELFGQYRNNTDDVELVTNGAILDKMSPAFFELLQKHEIKLKVTLHHPALHDRLTSFLKDISSPKTIAPYHHNNSFRKPYNIVDGKPVLFQSRPEMAWRICSAKVCRTLIDNQLHYCSVPAYFRKAHEHGIIDDARVLNYQLATPEMTDAELLQWHDSDYSKMCEVCPDKSHHVNINNKFDNLELTTRTYLTTTQT
jgi:organic radical activating enzyme